MKTKKLVLGAIGTISAIAIGVLVVRGLGEPADATAATAASGQQRLGATPSTGDPLPGEASHDPAAETAPYRESTASVAELKRLLGIANPTPEQIQELLELKQALLDDAENNSQALRGLIDALRMDPTSSTAEHLLSILGEVRDPAVEQLGLEMAISDDEEMQAVGLDLLARLGIAGQDTYELTKQLLADPDRDPEVLRSAIHAMPDIPLPASEMDSTVSRLGELSSTHADAGVRSESLFKLGAMAKDAGDIRPLLDALAPERSVDDRISAAMALRNSQVVDDGLRRQLLSLMSDPKELWEIRRYAAETLQRFKLSESDYSRYQRFNEELEVISSGG
ncbi:hypothetical protein [Marilutibacter alkalisoli]|uniref:HEAT repeat domain-containing protein n=1 Tax=Marilutibacter alkalisoli TaxID=2591633 RepID=A0A514BSC7_9GAMM|nr:hypothetical protein [Lysobacter alkalisoli]QDH70277.1 hypothetical protein FKV23_09360 [Lysobacter alkalisoli]